MHAIVRTMADSLSVLSHPFALATKRHYLGPDGQRLVDDYGKGARFECLTAPVESFEDLAQVLEQLLNEPRMFVIRGEPIPGRDLSDIRRAHKPKNGEPPGFRAVPRCWMMVDADQALTREDVADLDLLRPDHVDEGIKRLIARMPTELHGVKCFWQLSSNAGFKPGLRAHLWYWLDRPMSEKELTQWAENVNDAAGRRLIDASVFRTVQPNYTANPILDVGVSDPVGKRWGILDGAPCATLPKSAERTGAYLKKLAALHQITNTETHPALRDACASYFCARGADADAAELLGAMRRGVAVAHKRRGSGETIYDDAKLEEYVESGRQFARDRGSGAENLARNHDGTLKMTFENARSLVAAASEWDGVLAFNQRRQKAVLLSEPPFEDGYRGPTCALPRDWTDADDSRLVSWLQRRHDLAIYPAITAPVVDILARQNTFDPVVDYLHGLTWDKENREDWLTRFLGVPDSRYARRVGMMWLIQGVARALDPGCKADCVLILEGNQGLRRKSSILAALATRAEFFREGLRDIDTKDTLLAMQAAWIIELREMASITNREVEAVKAFLDRQNDHYRAPYGRRSDDHPRRCIFAGTTNASKYLRDVTGARRFWPVACGETDLEGLEAVVDQLWAEAVHRYLAGEQWWVEADDPDFVAEQDARYDTDTRQDMLEAALESGCSRPRFPSDPAHPVPPIEPKAPYVTVAQILYHHWNLKISDQDRRQQMAVSDMLGRLGWTSARTGQARRWRRPEVG